MEVPRTLWRMWRIDGFKRMCSHIRGRKVYVDWELDLLRKSKRNGS